MLTIDHDLHVHTYLSDGCDTAAVMIAEAEAVGLHTLGFADHVWDEPTGRDIVLRLHGELGAVSTALRVLVGCEAETYAPGRFSVSAEFARSVDFVLLACNHFHLDCVAKARDDSPRAIAEHMLMFFHSAVTSGLATVIPHPFIAYGYTEQYGRAIDAISDGEFLDAFGLAAERGVGIELTLDDFPVAESGSYGWGSAPVDTPLRFLSLARQAGCKFTFASDAHRSGKLRYLPKLGLLVQRLGLGREDIFALDSD